MEHRRAGDVVLADAPAENHTGRARFGPLSGLGGRSEKTQVPPPVGGRSRGVLPVGSPSGDGASWPRLERVASPAMRTGATTVSATSSLYQVKPLPY